MRRALQWGLLAAVGWLAVPEPITTWSITGSTNGPAGDPSSNLAARFVGATAIAAADVDDAESYLTTRSGRGHLIIQLPNRSARQPLEVRGVRFLRWRGRVDGRDEWFVSAPSTLFDFQSVRAHIAAAAPLDPSDRLHPRLRAGVIGEPSITPDGRWELRVLLADDADVEDVSAAVVAAGIDVRYTSELPRALVVVSRPEDVGVLAALDEVLWIRELGFGFTDANDANRALCRVEEVQDEGLDGAGIHVGIWDSGIPDQLHPDLFGRVVIADTVSTSNHASMVAGTIGGTGFASEGEGGTSLQWRGMAPAALVHGWDYFTAADSLPIDEMGPGIERFNLHSANHSYTVGVNEFTGNCSIYGDYDFDAPGYDLLLEPGAHDSVLVVFAAGNERDDEDCGLVGDPWVNYRCIPPPGTSKSVFTVGAVEADLDSMSRFSSWGPTDDGRLKPDLCAPGSQRSVDFGVTSTRAGGDYGTLTGTSFATPTVTGSAALLAEDYIDSVGVRPHPSVLKALMINTARDLGAVGPDYRYGHGVLDVAEALAALRRGDVYEGTVADQQVVDIPLVLPYSPDSIQVSIVWNDPAAVPLATVTLINDLDIELIAPDFTVHQAWVLDPDTPEAAATRGANTLDVIEQVRVSNPSTGTWTIRVTGTDVPSGPQPFALAYRGTVGPCVGDRLYVPFPFATLEGALATAADCDTVVLGAGTYSGPFAVTKPVVILGSQLGDAVLTAPDSLRILEISANATLEHLVFRGGRLAGTVGDTAQWTAPDSLGAAIYAHDAAVVVRNSRFTRNDAWGGGAIWIRDAETQFEGCDFDSNTAVVTGGAVLADSASVVTFLGCTFVDNSSAGNGGAVSADSSSTVTLDQSLFTANVSLGNGGAVHGVNAAVDTDRTRFTGNGAAHGGAVWLAGAASTFSTCDFDSNATSGAGGAVYVDSTSTVTVTNVLFHHNAAALNGGALFARGATVHLERSTLADNAADSSGGAIFVEDGDSLSVRSLIVVGNTASGADSVDGVRCAGPTLLECVVFWDQMQDSLGCEGGADILVVDPLFCDRAAADYHLDVSSPCTDENAPEGCGRIGSELVACGVVDVGASGSAATLVLGAPRPNPARGAARIAFEIPARQDVRLRVFDVGGRLVATLVESALDAGVHALTWDGRDAAGRTVSPGVYFYRLEAGARQISRKLVIIR